MKRIFLLGLLVLVCFSCFNFHPKGSEKEWVEMEIVYILGFQDGVKYCVGIQAKPMPMYWACRSNGQAVLEYSRVHITNWAIQEAIIAFYFSKYENYTNSKIWGNEKKKKGKR